MKESEIYTNTETVELYALKGLKIIQGRKKLLKT